MKASMIKVGAVLLSYQLQYKQLGLKYWVPLILLCEVRPQFLQEKCKMEIRVLLKRVLVRIKIKYIK